MTPPLIECMYCTKQIPLYGVREYTCPECWSRNTREFGPDWNKEAWHTELLPTARLEKREPLGLSGMTKLERANLKVVNIDLDTISTDEVDATLPPTPHVGRKPVSESTRQAAARMFVIESLTPRRIHEKLNENRSGKKVSLSTIYRLVRQIRELPLPGASTVD